MSALFRGAAEGLPLDEIALPKLDDLTNANPLAKAVLEGILLKEQLMAAEKKAALKDAKKGRGKSKAVVTKRTVEKNDPDDLGRFNMNHNVFYATFRDISIGFILDALSGVNSESTPHRLKWRGVDMTTMEHAAKTKCVIVPNYADMHLLYRGVAHLTDSAKIGHVTLTALNVDVQIGDDKAAFAAYVDQTEMFYPWHRSQFSGTDIEPYHGESRYLVNVMAQDVPFATTKHLNAALSTEMEQYWIASDLKTFKAHTHMYRAGDLSSRTMIPIMELGILLRPFIGDDAPLASKRRDLIAGTNAFHPFLLTIASDAPFPDSELPSPSTEMTADTTPAVSAAVILDSRVVLRQLLAFYTDPHLHQDTMEVNPIHTAAYLDRRDAMVLLLETYPAAVVLMDGLSLETFNTTPLDVKVFRRGEEVLTITQVATLNQALIAPGRGPMGFAPPHVALAAGNDILFSFLYCLSYRVSYVEYRLRTAEMKTKKAAEEGTATDPVQIPKFNPQAPRATTEDRPEVIEAPTGMLDADDMADILTSARVASVSTMTMSGTHGGMIGLTMPSRIAEFTSRIDAWKAGNDPTAITPPHMLALIGELADKDRRYTLLHIAALVGSMDAIRLLCDTGADVQATTALGRTPLMFSASAPVVRLLIERTLKSSAVKRALDDVDELIATQFIVTLPTLPGPNPTLLSVDAVDVGGDTALMHAASRGLLDVIEELLLRGAYIGHKNFAKRQVAHCAALGGRTEALQMLEAVGADIHAVDVFGEAPINAAIRTRSLDTMMYLLLAGPMDFTGQYALTREQMEQVIKYDTAKVKENGDANSEDSSVSGSADGQDEDGDTYLLRPDERRARYLAGFGAGVRTPFAWPAEGKEYPLEWALQRDQQIRANLEGRKRNPKRQATHEFFRRHAAGLHSVLPLPYTAFREDRPPAVTLISNGVTPPPPKMHTEGWDVQCGDAAAALLYIKTSNAGLIEQWRRRRAITNAVVEFLTIDALGRIPTITTPNHAAGNYPATFMGQTAIDTLIYQTFRGFIDAEFTKDVEEAKAKLHAMFDFDIWTAELEILTTQALVDAGIECCAAAPVHTLVRYVEGTLPLPAPDVRRHALQTIVVAYTDILLTRLADFNFEGDNLYHIAAFRQNIVALQTLKLCHTTLENFMHVLASHTALQGLVDLDGKPIGIQGAMEAGIVTPGNGRLLASSLRLVSYAQTRDASLAITTDGAIAHTCQLDEERRQAAQTVTFRMPGQPDGPQWVLPPEVWYGQGSAMTPVQRLLYGTAHTAVAGHDIFGETATHKMLRGSFSHDLALTPSVGIGAGGESSPLWDEGSALNNHVTIGNAIRGVLCQGMPIWLTGVRFLTNNVDSLQQPNIVGTTPLMLLLSRTINSFPLWRAALGSTPQVEFTSPAPPVDSVIIEDAPDLEWALPIRVPRTFRAYVYTSFIDAIHAGDTQPLSDLIAHVDALDSESVADILNVAYSDAGEHLSLNLSRPFAAWALTVVYMTISRMLDKRVLADVLSLHRPTITTDLGPMIATLFPLPTPMHSFWSLIHTPCVPHARRNKDQARSPHLVPPYCPAPASESAGIAHIPAFATLPRITPHRPCRCNCLMTSLAGVVIGCVAKASLDHLAQKIAEEAEEEVTTEMQAEERRRKRRERKKDRKARLKAQKEEEVARADQLRREAEEEALRKAELAAAEEKKRQEKEAKTKAERAAKAALKRRAAEEAKMRADDEEAKARKMKLEEEKEKKRVARQELEKKLVERRSVVRPTPVPTVDAMPIPTQLPPRCAPIPGRPVAPMRVPPTPVGGFIPAPAPVDLPPGIGLSPSRATPGAALALGPLFDPPPSEARPSALWDYCPPAGDPASFEEVMLNGYAADWSTTLPDTGVISMDDITQFL